MRCTCEVFANAFSVVSYWGNIRTHNSRTDSCRIFKLGGGIDYVTHHVYDHWRRSRSQMSMPKAHVTYQQQERYLWPPYGVQQAIIFLPCGFFFYLFFLASCRKPENLRYNSFTYALWSGRNTTAKRSHLCKLRIIAVDLSRNPKVFWTTFSRSPIMLLLFTALSQD